MFICYTGGERKRPKQKPMITALVIARTITTGKQLITHFKIKVIKIKFQQWQTSSIRTC